MAHGIKKMVYTPSYRPFSPITTKYFCEYWGLGEDSQQLQCNLDGREDSCDNCPYLTIKVVTSHTVQQTTPIYKCRILQQPIPDPMWKNGCEKRQCYNCPNLEIRENVNMVPVQVYEPESDFYVINPDFLEIL
jgi:hypothetical protein